MTLLAARGREWDLGSRPWLMGIVNATPDSFSDGGRHPTLASRLELARELLRDGADVIDIGGESGITGKRPLGAVEEIERVQELIARVSGELGALVSVDTYKPAVAEAAIAAGAAIVNDVSGLRDPELAEVCAAGGAALVLMHTRAAPKQRLQDVALYGGDVTSDVLAFLRTRIDTAIARGVPEHSLIVDPGPDFSKTPAQTVALLRQAPRLLELGRPVLMALSRKDFIGALTDRAPRERGAGTLAAISHGVRSGAHIFRVHDVAATADFLRVQAALSGAQAVDERLALAEELRWDKVAARADTGAGAGG
ncbi:MAG: dihydropteroate synthase [Solirubrobacteraceae bacterium]